MSPKLRFYVIVAMLALSFPIYLILMASLGENNLLLRIARLPGGFVVVLGILLVFSWAVSAILDISFILKRMFIKPKLDQMKRRIGRVLLDMGLLTDYDVDRALMIQRKLSPPSRVFS